MCGTLRPRGEPDKEFGECDMAEQKQPMVVLVHGGCAGAWCWAEVEKELDSRGVEHLAVDLPTVGAAVDPTLDFHTDAAHVRAIVDGLDRPVVLCGNSYGGVVISEASAGCPNVARLVYLAAVMPDEGDEIPSSILGSCTEEFMTGFAFNDNGLATFDHQLAKQLAFPQAPPDVAQWAAEHFRPMAMGGGATTTVSAVGWRNIPSTFVVSGEDRCIRVDVERRWALERATEWIEFPYDHCPQISHPIETAELLAKLAAT
jgi:pimeloyl-ACP methyl ester carboxylesterase